MKKLLSILLSVVIFVSVFGTFPIIANAAKVVTSGSSLDCDWNFNTETGELTVTAVRNTGKMFDYEIEEGEGYPEWHAYKDLIKTVTIEDGVSTIADNGFYRCRNIKKLNIANSVESIGVFAFYGCSSLTEVVLPTGNTGSKVFALAFANCSKLKKVVIPEGVSAIGDDSFGGCDALKSVNIPKSVNRIASVAFSSKNLKNIYVDKDNKNYCDVNGNLYNKSKTTFLEYAPGKTESKFRFPNKVNKIGSYAFTEVENLEKIIIPVTVKKINYEAFFFMSEKINIKYLGTTKQFKKFKIAKDSIITSCSFKPKHKKNVFHINETDRLKVTSNISTKDNATTFKSSNPTVMRVSKHGKVRAVKKGKVTITVKRNGGIVKKKVTVKS